VVQIASSSTVINEEKSKIADIVRADTVEQNAAAPYCLKLA
jgi:hypothetical protein